MAKDNTLYLRRDKNPRTERHPPYRGSGVVFGQEVWVSAYVNDGEDRDGKPEKYFKISVQPKGQQTGDAAAAPEMSDDIPF